jgi:hypothetical protein
MIISNVEMGNMESEETRGSKDGKRGKKPKKTWIRRRRRNRWTRKGGEEDKGQDDGVNFFYLWFYLESG